MPGRADIVLLPPFVSKYTCHYKQKAKANENNSRFTQGNKRVCILAKILFFYE
jgi:hypothetical protein